MPSRRSYPQLFFLFQVLFQVVSFLFLENNGLVGLSPPIILLSQWRLQPSGNAVNSGVLATLPEAAGKV